MKYNRDPWETVVAWTDRSNKAPNGDGDFYNAPYWNFNDRLKFNSNNVDNHNPNFGSASFVSPVCHFF